MPKLNLTQTFIDNLKPEPDKPYVDYIDHKVSGLILKMLRSGKKTYFVQYVDANNIRQTKRLSVVDASAMSLEMARQLCIEKLAMVAQGIDPFPKKEAKPEIITVGEFIDRKYMPHIKGYKRSWDTDVSLIKNHIIPAIGKLKLNEVKRHHLVELFANHRATHAAGSTNRIIILMRYIFNLAIRWEMEGIQKNPADGIDLYPDAKKLERFLTPEDAQRLFVALEQSEAPMLKYIIAMLLLTGARKNEVLQSKWSDFDLNKRIWSIEFNKTGKPRYVPLSDGAVNLLQSLPRIEGCEYPFANPATKKPFVQIFHTWNLARTKAGMPELRIHDLRHSFASFLVNSGRSLYEVQKLLGHTQIKTTQRYAHLSNDTLLDAANLASKSVPLALVMPKTVTAVPMIATDTQQ